MKFTRATFGQHKQGYVFPLLLAVNALEDCFAGVMQRIDTTDEFIFFYDKSFVISGASEKSFRMLGVWPFCLPNDTALSALRRNEQR